MKPIHDFVAARPLARHCPELLPPRRDPADQLPELARLGSKLAPLLKARLSALHGDEGLNVATLALRDAAAETELVEAETLTVHWLLAVTPARLPVLVSAEAGPVLRMVDRAFGGRGQSPATLPEVLSPTAELFAARLGTAVADCLAEALGDAAGGAVQRQASALAELSPFAPTVRLAVLDCEMAEPGRAPWTLRFALPLGAVPDLLAGSPSTATAPRGPADPHGEPFGAVPLTLSAVLVDMAVPMATVAALVPGALLPVAIARRVPLRVGTQTFAAGTVGVQDDRVALQLAAPPQHLAQHLAQQLESQS